MDQQTAIKAMEAHSAKFGLKVTTIGQMAVNNRYAYDRLKKGSAHVSTVTSILKWIAEDAAAREERGAA